MEYNRLESGYRPTTARLERVEMEAEACEMWRSHRGVAQRAKSCRQGNRAQVAVDQQRARGPPHQSRYSIADYHRTCISAPCSPNGHGTTAATVELALRRLPAPAPVKRCQCAFPHRRRERGNTPDAHHHRAPHEHPQACSRAIRVYASVRGGCETIGAVQGDGGDFND